ncbi:MAG: thioredoxin family protein [Pseudomonadota bacterium]
MRLTRDVILTLTVLGLVACTPAEEETVVRVDDVAVVAETAAAEIAWRKEDVLEAFADAAATGHPILLYWGAEWCPPCHRLRAGLFMDPEFVARTQDFVPVYLDGDTEGAQRWGEHFAIAGYPTIILLRPDGTEMTRLSGSEDPDEIDNALRAAQENRAGAAELFARAKEAPASLDAEDWTLIASYGWEVDISGLFADDEKAPLLRSLAAAAPDAALQRRFMLLALADDIARDAPLPAEASQQEIRALLSAVFANTAEVKRSRWPLMYDGAALIERAGGTADERKTLEDALVAALDQLYTDESLPIVDRVLLVKADIGIHQLNMGEGAAPPALLEKVRARAAWADSVAKTPQERQSAIYYAAGLLQDAGDAEGAERLLTAELERSATPYYYMPSLAEIAEARGDNQQAIDWLKQGYETSSGLATRVQWGVLYASGVLRLTPDDKAGVESAVDRIIEELGNPDSYHQRTRDRLTGLAMELEEWSQAQAGTEEVLERLRTHMHEVCAPAQSEEDARAACLSWLATQA